MGGLVFLLLTAVLFYFFLVRPQQRRVRQHSNLVTSLEVGNEVVTAGGVVGNITQINERDVLLQVAPNVELRVVKGAIAQKKPDDVESTK